MKKFILIAVAMLTALATKAQTVEYVAGEQQKIFVEKTDGGENHLAYAYMESTFNEGAMCVLFWEQKFWQTPVFIHAEFQSTFDGCNTYALGATYSYYTQHGSISLNPNFRYDGTAAFSLTEINFFDWSLCELYCCNSAWWQGGLCFVGEERFHFKVGKHFAIGANLYLTYFGEFKATPTLGLRYDF